MIVKLILFLKHLLEGSGVQFIQDTVQKIDLENRQVELVNSGLEYKYLVLALGSQTGYFRY